MAKKKEEEVLNIAKLEERRENLKKELEELQGQLEQTMDELKEGMTSRLDPNYWIRKYPFQSLGVSVFVGFLLGIRNNSVNSSGIHKAEPSKSSKEESIIWSELKRAAIRRGVQKLVDAIDQKLDEMAKE